LLELVAVRPGGEARFLLAAGEQRRQQARDGGGTTAAARAPAPCSNEEAPGVSGSRNSAATSQRRRSRTPAQKNCLLNSQQRDVACAAGVPSAQATPRSVGQEGGGEVDFFGEELLNHPAISCSCKTDPDASHWPKLVRCACLNHAGPGQCAGWCDSRGRR